MDHTFLFIGIIIILLGFALAVILITEDALHEAERERKLAEDAARRWDAFKAKHRDRW